MTIFQVRRPISDVRNKLFPFQKNALGAMRITEGFQKLVREERGLRTLEIPITIEGNSVTLHVRDAKGRLEEAFFPSMGSWVSFAEGQDHELIDTTIDLTEGQAALYFIETRSIVSLLERHKQTPLEFGLGRRK